VIVAQIGDTHIDPARPAASGRIDTAETFSRCIAQINALDPQPDLVLHTGDLVERRTPEEYARFRELAGPLRAPFYAIPGNHDGRDAMRAAFTDASWMPQDGPFIQYTIEDAGPLRIVALDCTIPGSGSGELCDARLAWLATRLAESPARPTIVALHHPPFPTGIPEIDRGGFGGLDAFKAIIAEHAQVERIICGHVHRAMQIRFGGTIASTVPSTCYQFALDTSDGAPLAYLMEPPAFALHQWTPHGLLSNLVPVGDWDGPFPFLKDGRPIR